MPVRTTPSAAGAEDRADRLEHRIDRRQAARSDGAAVEAHDRPVRPSTRLSDAHRPGAMMMRSGSERHAVLGDQRLALRRNAELAGEHAA